MQSDDYNEITYIGEMLMNKQIEAFLKSAEFGVVGASSNRSKYGNKVLRCYMQHDKIVYPINPHEEIIEGLPALHSVEDLPDAVASISIITPPKITEKIVLEAINKGIKNIWMQPGAESDEAIQNCLDHHINIIANGPCILVAMGYKEM